MTERPISEPDSGPVAALNDEQRLRLLFDYAPDAYFLFDLRGRLVEANRAAEHATGRIRAELVGKTFRDLGLLPIDQISKAARALALSALGETTGPDEYRLHCTDDRDAVVEIRTYPFRINEKHLVLGTARDVTDRKQLESQLRQAQKMEAVGQLSGGIAHDFNNLLSVVGLNAETARAALITDPAAALASLDDIQGAVRQASLMTKQLMSFSRQADLVIVPAEIARILPSIASMLRRVLPANIDLQIAPSSATGLARVDARAFEQVILNLATNARDAMPAGGLLAIGLSTVEPTAKQRAEHPWISPGAFVCVTVTDTGSGMNAEALERVFEPFYTTKPVGVGTGLGMTMVYGLMKQHGGFVNVRSELGAGTTIQLHLPVARSAAMTPSEPETVAYALGSETILLVEDDESLRRAGRRVLELHGYTVMTARNGVEGLEMILAHVGEIDLVIADLVMPLMGGAELHGAVSQAGTPPKFIFASGYGGGDQAARSQLDRNISLIEKPWTFAKLLGAVRDTLDHGRSPEAKR